MIFALSPSLLEKHAADQENSDYYSVFQELVESISYLLGEKQSNDSIIQRIMTSYFILANSYQSYIFQGDTILFQTGLNILQDNIIKNILAEQDGSNSVHQLGPKEKFSNLKETEFKNKRFRFFLFQEELLPDYRMIIALPVDMIPNYYDLQPIIHILKNYYSYQVSYLVEDYPNLFHEFLSQLKIDINHNFSNSMEYGVISKFYLQDIRPYYGVMGEETTGMVLDYIQSTLQSKMKDIDYLYRPGQRTLVTFSPNCNEEVIKKRFDSLFFQYKYLIINYRLSHLMVRKPILNEENFWLEVDQL